VEDVEETVLVATLPLFELDVEMEVVIVDDVAVSPLLSDDEEDVLLSEEGVDITDTEVELLTVVVDLTMAEVVVEAGIVTTVEWVVATTDVVLFEMIEVVEGTTTPGFVVGIVNIF